MGKQQYWPFFQCISEVSDSGLIYYPVSIAESINQGTPLLFSSGYVIKATTTLAGVLAGIAQNTTTAAQAVASGTISAPVIPLLKEYRWMVPVGSAAVITQAAVGAQVSNIVSGTPTKLDITSALSLGTGFVVDAIDISAAALAANSKGFAIGHFEYVAAS